MSEKSQNPSAKPSSTDDLGAAEVQQQMDKEQAQGFVGTAVDPTPNEAYTLQGGPAGVGTPEGDRGKPEKKG